MSEPIIRVYQYHKVYGETVAVQDLSFDVLPGQIVGMLGPNGAGKTTTMRALAGIIPPTQGRLLVAGHDVATQPVAAKQALAYVPDDPKLFESLSVDEHIYFTAQAYGIREYEARADELLRQFELDDKRHKLAQELSRGMRQKVAIVCAYLYRPKAILFDEPLTGLDPRAIRTLKQSIRDEAAAGMGIVVSSHLLDLVEDLCTDLLVIHEGKRLFFGPTGDARRAIEGMADTATLEDVYFHLTERPSEPAQTADSA